MSTTDTTNVRERHVLAYADCEVQVVLSTDGDASIEVTAYVGQQASFDTRAWEEVTRFVAASLEMTAEDAGS